MDVYGVGNALVDVQVRVDEDFIVRHGLKKGHMELVDARRQAQVLGALAGHPVNRCSGGSAANTVVGVAGLGGRAAYCGKWRVNAKLAGPRQRAGDKSEGAFEQIDQTRLQRPISVAAEVVEFQMSLGGQLECGAVAENDADGATGSGFNDIAWVQQDVRNGAGRAAIRPMDRRGPFNRADPGHGMGTAAAVAAFLIDANTIA